MSHFTNKDVYTPRQDDNMQTEKTPPSAEAMILSLRAMGYDLSTAIAD